MVNLAATPFFTIYGPFVVTGPSSTGSATTSTTAHQSSAGGTAISVADGKTVRVDSDYSSPYPSPLKSPIPGYCTDLSYQMSSGTVTWCDGTLAVGRGTDVLDVRSGTSVSTFGADDLVFGGLIGGLWWIGKSDNSFEVRDARSGTVLGHVDHVVDQLAERFLGFAADQTTGVLVVSGDGGANTVEGLTIVR